MSDEKVQVRLQSKVFDVPGLVFDCLLNYERGFEEEAMEMFYVLSCGRIKGDVIVKIMQEQITMAFSPELIRSKTALFVLMPEDVEPPKRDLLLQFKELEQKEIQAFIDKHGYNPFEKDKE